DRFSRSGLTDDRLDGARRDCQRHVVNGTKLPLSRGELNRQILNLKEGHQLRFSFGSRASRRPSPIKLMASTTSRMAIPGNVTTHQALRMNSRASASIVPHSGVGGCAPMPRKPSAAAFRMASEKDNAACTISGAVTLGSMTRNIRRRG